MEVADGYDHVFENLVFHLDRILVRHRSLQVRVVVVVPRKVETRSLAEFIELRNQVTIVVLPWPRFRRFAERVNPELLGRTNADRVAIGCEFQRSLAGTENVISQSEPWN